MIVLKLSRSFKIDKALAMLGLFFLWGLLSFSGCQESRELTHLTGRTMGTHYNVKYYSSKNLANKENVQGNIDRILKQVNSEMSTYMKSSEISYFNKSDHSGPIKISEDFFYVASYALSLAEKTNGAFDPTLGPLVNLWGFGPDGKRKVPSDEDISKALSKVGFQKVELNSETREIKKTVPGVYLDLSALAKGFGVDKVAKFLEDQGAKSLMVEIGGEVVTRGVKEDGGPWKIAIETPDPASNGESYQKVLDLKDVALATSGSYRNFFEEGGKNYSHTIDSKTGRPINHKLVSVSVVDKDCMVADALATALMAMGEKRAIEFAERENLMAYFVYGINEAEGGKTSFKAQGSSEFNKKFGTK